MNVKTLLFIIALLVSFTLVACGTGKKDTADSKSEPQATDYSKPGRWLSLHYSAVRDVDVFYIYPTSWQNDPKVPNEKSDPYICRIDNPSMLIGSKEAFESQATVFETVGNIYAPYYRQVDAGYALSLGIEKRDELLRGIPKSDIFTAFDFYITQLPDDL